MNQPRHQYCLPSRGCCSTPAPTNDPQTLYNRQFRPPDDLLELLFEYGLGADRGGPWYSRFGPALPTVSGALQDQLLWAVEQDMPARVELLLAHGVDPDSRNSGGSAYELAARSGSPHLGALLVAAGAAVPAPDPVQAFLGAAMSGDHGRLVNIRPRTTPLHEAASTATCRW